MAVVGTEQKAITSMRRGLGVLAILVAIFVAGFSWMSWQEEKAAAIRSLAAVSELGAASLDAYFGNFESVLRFAGDDIARRAPHIDLRSAHLTLQHARSLHPDLRDVTLVRLDGQVLAAAGSPPGTNFPSVGDVPSFTLAREELQGGQRLSIARPYVGRIARDWIIPLRYGVRDRAGVLQFILTATLPLTEPQSFWNGISLPEGGAIGLIRDDGFLISRYPIPRSVDFEAAYGKPRTGALIEHLRREHFPPRGQVEGASSLSGPNHLIVYRRLASYPITFFITTPASNAIGAWWSKTLPLYLLLALLLLVGYGVYRWMLGRQLAWEAERSGAEQRVLASQLQLQGIIDSATDAVVSVDAAQRVILFNSAAERMFGYTAAQIAGQPLARLIPERFRSDHPAQVDQFGRSGLTNRRMGSMGSVMGRNASGAEFPVEASISKLSLGDQPVYTAILRDISDRRRMEAELVRAMNEAERANTAKSEFLASMSHELRTPLNAILGFAQLLEINRQTPLTERQAGAVGQIVQSGWHLLKLIDDVLDLSRIESGRMVLSCETVPVTDLVRDCVALVTPLAQPRRVALHAVVTAAPQLHVRADPTRLKQVLLNLLSNAVKYNREGGSVSVTCDCPEATRVRITVTDTGLGMTPQQMKSLFRPFERLGREGSDIEGTGIGLAITRQLVELMDGKIGVESEAGKGSRFSVELPLATPAAHTPETDQPAADAAAALETHTVLYVEDNRANVELMTALFEQHARFSLLHAGNGPLGVELARTRQPDMVVIDINLPGFDGYEVLERLRRSPATRDIPCIALSANAKPEDAEKALQAGFLAYFTKPVEIRAFMEKVEQILAGRRA